MLLGQHIRLDYFIEAIFINYLSDFAQYNFKYFCFIKLLLAIYCELFHLKTKRLSKRHLWLFLRQYLL